MKLRLAIFLVFTVVDENAVVLYCFKGTGGEDYRCYMEGSESESLVVHFHHFDTRCSSV